MPTARLLVLALLTLAANASAAPAASGSPARGALQAAPKPTAAEKRSPVPTAKEWVTAEPAKLSRTSSAAKDCAASRVREWLRVHCRRKTFAISLLGGTSEGLSFWIGPEADGQPGEVQFPLRRGDRRVVQLWKQGTDEDGHVVPEPSLVLQESWLDADPEPTISVL